MENLKDFRIVEKYEKEPLQVNEAIINFCTGKKPIIISSVPGMGKSIFINYFARNAPTDFWVIKINLMKYKTVYKKFITESERASNLEIFFRQILEEECKENLLLVKAVFAKFNETKNIVMLLDGFDEIPISYQKHAKQFIKFVSESGYFVLITTRPVYRHDMETLLGTLSLDLNLFTRKNQQYFLENYFSRYSGTICKTETTTFFVDSLLNAAENNLNDHDNEFTGVPLETLMLAEVFLEDFKRFVETNNFIDVCFDLLYLYKNFIKKKARIACERFGQISEDMKHHYKVCKSFYALRLVFSEENLNELQIDLKLEYGKSLFPHMLELLQKDGIVVAETETSVRFVHQSFAEYLAGKWLAKNIKNENETIVKRLLKATFDPKLKVVRNIFDRILAKNCPLHLAIINFQTDKAASLIMTKHFDDVDGGRRNCLHLLSSWGFYHPEEEDAGNLIHISKMSKTDQMIEVLNLVPNEKLNICKDDILGFTPVDYAIVSSSLYIANTLCLRMKHLRISINAEKPIFNDISHRSHILFHKYTALCRAVVTNKSIDSNLFIDEDQNSLSYVISKGDTRKLNELLLGSTDVNKRDKFDLTPLLVAVRLAREDIVEILLRHGADANATDNSGKTPLHWSVIVENLNILRLLINKGADVNIVDSHKRSALHYAVIACLGHQNEMIRELWNTNLRITDEYEHTPFLWSIYLGYSECAKLFLEMDIDQEEKNRALHVAANTGEINMIDLLLSNGADVHASDIRNVTPIVDSTVHGNVEVLHHFLHRGINMQSIEYDGRNLLYAAISMGYQDVVDLLLSHGFDIESKDNTGGTSLHVAADYGHISIVELLLSKGANINAKDNDGRTAMVRALHRGYTQIVALLLSEGSEIELALHAAACRGRIDLMNLFLSRHADVNLRDTHDVTALQCAALCGQEEAAAFLLTKGADIGSKMGALVTAILQDEKEIANMLLEEVDMETAMDEAFNDILGCEIHVSVEKK
ncbi:hypothetical protein ILUMI_22242 [Ignelater luminosus]|uniref:NACHT domain-containing protein n=1 Tax=Ignelater luminosus TaxID=2038154 RepID=A0A8K0CAI0_IGNLU|nr:hypothetical protein ILUMI_22242 [Ignelater luminosus]